MAIHLLDGLSRKEIAARLGVSPSYASTLCEQAEVALRAAYIRAGGSGDLT